MEEVILKIIVGGATITILSFFYAGLVCFIDDAHDFGIGWSVVFVAIFSIISYLVGTIMM